MEDTFLTDTKKRPSEDTDGVLTGQTGVHRCKKAAIAKLDPVPFLQEHPGRIPNEHSVSVEDPQVEVRALWDQQLQKDAQIMLLQKKLGHYKSWISSLQNKVAQQNPQALKNAKRLYIGGFPGGTTEEDLRLFLSHLLKQTGGCSQPGNAIISVKIMKDKNFAFAEFRSVEETANTTAFDGVVFESSRLKIRRPSNYDVGSAILLGPVTPDPTMDLSSLDICRSTVDDSPHKLFIGGLPYDYTEEMVRDLVGTYAAVKSFNLVMDRATGKSKGYAFCELEDESMTDVVIQQLHTYKLGNKLLTVKRALEGGRNSSSQTLTSMLTSSGTSQSFSSDIGGLYSSDVSGLHQSIGYGGFSPPNMNPPGLLHNPMTGLSGMNIGSSSMIGASQMSAGSLQANNMLSQIINQPSLLSSHQSFGSFSGEGIPVPDVHKSINSLHGSYGIQSSLGGNSISLNQHDLKADPDICHSFDQSILDSTSTSFLSQSGNMDSQLGWRLHKQ